MKTQTDHRPGAFEGEPLLAGVEDNPVFRLLVIHYKNHRHSNKSCRLTSHGFGFAPECRRDLDATLLNQRDYAQAIWAYRAIRSGLKKRALRLRIGLSLAAMPVVGGLLQLAPDYFSILTAALALHLIVVGHAWGNARSHLPALVDLVHEFLIVRKTRSLKPFFLDSVLFFINVGILSAAFAAFITACAVVMALNLPVVFAPLWFLAVGFLSIAGGRGLAQIKLLSLENQKRALYRKLIYEIFLLTRIRRENENG